ncbi:uncharacterized protein CEXT_732291 [Caerostris extrusa]|uniref:Uncharacterized protein n=1 Tax=Caerostris extrusa TaxID=172846 RepID=A0AAV4Y4S1_CAEEX|nr:uncharacterized protein CEXT_732291 [Caerostris extrusa]
MAFKIINISKDVPLNIATNSTAIKTVPLSFAPEEKKTHSKDVKIKTELELHEIMTDLDDKDMTEDYLKSAKKENFADNININNLTIDLSKMIYSKLTNILRKQIHLLFSKAFPPNNGSSSNSENMKESKSNDSLSDGAFYKLSSDKENNTKNEASVIPSQSRTHSARQFVFHPYLPYGKDVAPDEKNIYHDVLPIKMVKFIKSMVEDAPWEQMFMKMVRMVVDQFVTKLSKRCSPTKRKIMTNGDHWKMT